LIAGKNGSGKTRILNKIFNTFSLKPQKSRLAQSLIDKKNYLSNISSYKQSLSQFENLLKTQTETNQREETQRNIENYKKNIVEHENAIKNCENEQKWNLIETDLQAEIYSFVRFVPKSLALQDC